MTGFVVERHGYISGSTLVADIVTDMIANGFTLQYQTGDSGSWNPGSVGDVYKVILEASGDVDPLNASNIAEKQAWRVCFDVQAAQNVFVYLGTSVQLPDTGTVAVVTALTSGKTSSGQSVLTTKSLVPYDIVGAIGDQVGNAWLTSSYTTTSGTKAAEVVPALVDKNGKYSAPTYTMGISSEGPTGTPSDESLLDETTKGLFTRARRVASGMGESFPMSYRLVITPRGMWLGVWEEAVTTETSALFNWFLVQRPVDRDTGAVITSGKAPVFCINAVGGEYWQFTVREQDIFRPGKRRAADVDSEDSECIINVQDQVSLAEDGKFIVTFPSRLNTSRYRYPHELDMIGITSADVVSQETEVPLTVYGEANPRTYLALHANGEGNTGMRLLVLQEGGGIS